VTGGVVPLLGVDARVVRCFSSADESAHYGFSVCMLLEHYRAQLHWEEQGVVELECSPARSITLLTGRTKGARVNAGEGAYIYSGEIEETNADGLITRARLTRPAGTPYGRIEVEDVHGRRAWTNPLWP